MFNCWMHKVGTYFDTLSSEELSERSGVRSLRLLKQANPEIFKSLHVDHTTLTNDSVAIDQWSNGFLMFSPLLM